LAFCPFFSSNDSVTAILCGKPDIRAADPLRLLENVPLCEARVQCYLRETNGVTGSRHSLTSTSSLIALCFPSISKKIGFCEDVWNVKQESNNSKDNHGNLHGCCFYASLSTVQLHAMEL
jgi:hypothetical protein